MGKKIFGWKWEKAFGRMRGLTRVGLLLLALGGVCAGGAWYWGPGSILQPVRAARRILPPAMGGFHSLEGYQFPVEQGSGAAIVGAYEGEFSASTHRLTIRPWGESPADSGQEMAGPAALPHQQSIGTVIPSGPTGFSLAVVNSIFVNDGINPSTVSGEIRITNNTSSTFYNTRLIFTRFVQSNGANAGNTPGTSGFAYFNDGMLPYDGKLQVSRQYGDIAPGGNARNVWNFAVTSTPQTFRFGFVVLADLGVTVESLSPAAVQVTSATGTSIQIRGRGFSSPGVQLLSAAGSVISTATVNSSTSEEIVATIPAGTPAGNYGVRVINQGGQAGGAGSSTLPGRLTVTAPPEAARTISGAISAFSDTGPYLISGNATLANPTTIQAGTVLYIASGATLTLGSGGTLTANGGVPGVSMTGVATPNQIVFTAQRPPGTALPTAGAWGGIQAQNFSSQILTLRNVVIEYGGTSSGAALNLTGSGRTLRMTDSIVQLSAGSGIMAVGEGDRVQNFSRNRLERNGTASTHSAFLVSGNASLGLYELPDNTIATGTSVADPSYFYAAANIFQSNQINAVEIGISTESLTNDFSISGVLVGQGTVPIIIRGGASNPAIIGSVGPGTVSSPGLSPQQAGSGAEVTIGPTTTIQLAGGMDLQVGDFASNRRGGLSANGYAGNYLGTQPATSNRSVTFQSVPGGPNFGSIFFTRRALPSSILNNVQIERGGNGQQGSVPLIVEAVSLPITNSRIDGGLLETLGAVVDKRGSGFVNTTNSPIIETVAGGTLGNGNLSTQATLVNPVSLALDPLGRGVFFSDNPTASYIRFLNTKRETVVIAGMSIPAGTVRIIGGGGEDAGEDVLGTDADLGVVSGLAVSLDGGILYYIDSIQPAIRAINISSTSRMVAGASAGVGRIRTFAAQGFGSALFSLAVNPFTGDIFVCDSTQGTNKVLRFSASQSTPNALPFVFAGSGAVTRDTDPFVQGTTASSIALLLPRAIAFRGSSLIVSDTGHARVLQISSSGSVTLVSQLPPNANNLLNSSYTTNPYTSGVVVYNDRVILANGNSQDLIRIDTNSASSDSLPSVTTLAGKINVACDYTLNQCGDGGPASDARFNFLTRSAQTPLVGVVADAQGIFLADQGGTSRGRIRYMNLSTSRVELAGVTIDPGSIATVAGAALIPPFFDGGLATSAALNQPQGVTMDSEGNLWITDTNSNKLRFINLSTRPKTIFAGTLSSKTVSPGSIVTINDAASQADPTPVINAFFTNPTGIQTTSEGLFIADTMRGPATVGTPARKTGLIRYLNTTNQSVQMPAVGDNSVLTVDPGQIITVSGGSTDSSSLVGDNARGEFVKYIAPTDIAIHPTNRNIYVADAGNNRVRVINRTTGNTTSLSLPVPAGSTQDSINQITGLVFDSGGRLLVVDPLGRRIMREKNPGSGSTANGAGFDILLSGGLLNRPRDIVEGADGAYYIVNAGDPSGSLATPAHQILRMTVNETTKVGTATVYLGGTVAGYRGDGGPITAARISIQPEPVNVATIIPQVFVRTTVNIIRGLNGELIFTDSRNNAIRRIR